MRISILHIGQQADPDVLLGYQRALAAEIPSDWSVDTHVVHDIEQSVRLLESAHCCLVDADDVSYLHAVCASSPRAFARSMMADLLPHADDISEEADRRVLGAHKFGAGVQSRDSLVSEDAWSSYCKRTRLYVRADVTSRIRELEEAKRYVANHRHEERDGYFTFFFKVKMGVLRWCFLALATS